MMAPSTLFFLGGWGRVVTNSMNKGKTMTEPRLLPLAIVLALCTDPTWADVQCGERFVTLPGIVWQGDQDNVRRLHAEFKQGPNPFTEFLDEEAQMERKRKKELNPFSKMLEPMPTRTVTIDKSAIMEIHATEPNYIMVYAPFKGSIGKGSTVLFPRTVVTWPKFREDLIDCLD